MKINLNPEKRFSDRVENYVKYRPGYPADIISYLKNEIELSDSMIVADIGSGTGIFSKFLLPYVKTVYAVEPNKEMREAAEKILNGNSNFFSVEGISVNTNLPDNHFDVVVAAQAFHWFDVPKTKIEFQRILKRNGNVILVWNSRKSGLVPFLDDYEKMLIDYATDYISVNHKNIDEKVFKNFFSTYRKVVFDNYQEFDLDGFKGRLLSCSYAPLPDHPNYNPIMKRLEEIFEKHQIKGKVRFDYETELYLGKL